MAMRSLKPSSKAMELNITSLMDIMTIILIFLLMSFDSSEHEVKPPEGFELPMSIAEKPIELAIKVTISREELRVEGTRVVRLKNGKVRKSLMAGSAIKPLLKELKRQKAKAMAGINSGQTDENNSEVLYFEAEKGIHYDLIDQVLKTAASAGFTKFRLAVSRKV